ncbi:C17 cyclopropane fatty acid synthase CfaB [Pseudomonas sp. No.117]
MYPTLPTALQRLNLPLRIRIDQGPEIDLGAAPRVTLVVKDPQVLANPQQLNLDTLGRAFVESRIDLEGDIQEVIEIGDRLSQALAGVAPSADVAPQPHDKATDASAVAYHYDLSNDFYRLWLDPELVYSCAYFQTGEEDLATAQRDKLELLCRKLRLQPGERLLDVGCGWGGLARHAAREHGVQVHGITLSREQLELARARVAAEGLADQVTLELLDYRDLPGDGRYDKVVSVGMFEHVGLANLPLYFRTLFDAVRPGGLVLNHGITALHADGRAVGHGGGDFIDRYVFPHGELPHLSLAVAEMSAAGLEVVDVESLRRHYARTLDFWSAALEARLEEAARLVPAEALRIWRLYLPGCAYAFRKNWVNIHQLLAARPHADGRLELPWSRGDLYG